MFEWLETLLPLAFLKGKEIRTAVLLASVPLAQIPSLDCVCLSSLESWKEAQRRKKILTSAEHNAHHRVVRGTGAAQAVPHF
ncbi:hypothetical protein NQZ68_037166, partial [Dissostichus eleginoides]